MGERCSIVTIAQAALQARNSWKTLVSFPNRCGEHTAELQAGGLQECRSGAALFTVGQALDGSLASVSAPRRSALHNWRTQPRSGSWESRTSPSVYILVFALPALLRDAFALTSYPSRPNRKIGFIDPPPVFWFIFEFSIIGEQYQWGYYTFRNYIVCCSKMF